MLHIRRMDWRGELGWMSQLPRELYSQPAVYCKSHLGISLNDRLSETDLSTRWPWLMLMKTTMTLFAPSSSLSSRFDHILLYPFHKHIKGHPGLPSPVCDVTVLSDALLNPTGILVWCETFWFTLKLHELCFIEGKTRTQTRRCWESVNRWVENCSNSVKLCRSRLSNMFAEFGSKTDLQGIAQALHCISQGLWSTMWAIHHFWKRASWKRTSSNTRSGWT